MATAGMGGDTSGNDHYLLQDAKYGLSLLQQLNELRIAGVFTDTVLCVGHEEFTCHKNILSASSHYFQAMYRNDLRENRDRKVVFDDISPWTLKRIIDYVYTGRLEITSENAQEMLAAGCQFHYPAIVDACCEFLRRQLHPSNCLGIQNFAQIHSCQTLEENATKFALENFAALVDYDEFLDLSIERLMLFVSSDLIEVRNEETVYQAIIRWIRFDLEDRKQYLYQMMQEIRLPVIDISNLRAMEQESIIVKCEKSLALVREAQVKHETIHDQYGRRRRSMQDTQVHPRPSTIAKEVLVVVGGLNGYVTKSVEMYDPLKDMWSFLPEFPKPVTWFSVSAVVNSIIVAGGILDGRIINNVWRFDSLRRVWHEITPLSHPRAKHSSAVLNDLLYIFGGVTYASNFEVVDQGCIECYDPSLRTWSIVGHSSFPRTQSRIVPYNNTLVEVGGLQGEVKVNTMECYECITGSPDVKPLGEHFILPEAIEHAQIVVLNGVFFIIWEDSKKMITLDPEKRTFQRLTDMNFSHKHSAASVLHNKIYVTGGMVNVSGSHSESRSSKIVECYDPDTNEWTLEKQLLEARGYHGCVTVNM